MADILLMLALSPTMETGTIQKWHFNEGDAVKEGDILCEVETDKATMEYESFYEGILLKIIIGEGGSIKVGDPIGIVGKKGEDISDLIKDSGTNEKKETGPIPKVQTIMEVSNIAGIPESLQAPQVISRQGKIHASPLARKLAGTKNINLALVKGTGPGGRIIKRDIEAYQEKAPIQTVVHTLSQSITRTPMSEIRKVIARRITESKQTRPHFYLRVGVNMTTILESRIFLNAKQAEKISLNAFILKFVAEALKKNPGINVSTEGQEILTYAHADIGIAVALTDGLITPVVRDCGAKSIQQIHFELKDLISRAREKKLEPHEFMNSTFTISNLGSFGIDEFTAIINPPNSAILAIGTIKKLPRVNSKDEIVILPVSQFTLSCDHRVIDGVVGARFLNDLKTIMENPISVFY